MADETLRMIGAIAAVVQAVGIVLLLALLFKRWRGD